MTTTTDLPRQQERTCGVFVDYQWDSEGWPAKSKRCGARIVEGLVCTEGHPPLVRHK